MHELTRSDYIMYRCWNKDAIVQPTSATRSEGRELIWDGEFLVFGGVV